MAVRTGEKEVMNPVAIRQMAEMSVKEAGNSHPTPFLGDTQLITRQVNQVY
jgi:hypothetical protein